MYEDAIVSTLQDRQAVSILPFPESVFYESSMSDNKMYFSNKQTCVVQGLFSLCSKFKRAAVADS